MTATVLQRRKSPVRPAASATIDASGSPHRAPIAERILDCFPSGSYALSALLRLLDIVETDAVPTAAVECRVQPRLLVNPRFVATHAATPEKLLMLVMHELHHVLLGHTTLFPTVTPEQNFVFDAVINGLISRMFPHPSFLSFLTDFYPADSFPSCLLRPPPGWPEEPRIAPGLDALPAALRSRAVEIHHSLYSEGGATYDEVASLLPQLLVGTNTKDVPLLGGHGESSATMGGLERRSPVLFDIVRDIVERWPQPPDPIRGRSLSELLKVTRIVGTPPVSKRSVLRGLIRKIANLGASGDFRQPAFDTLTVPTPLPVLSRRTAVLQALGPASTALRWAGPLAAPNPRRRARACVPRRVGQHGHRERRPLRRDPRLQVARPPAHPPVLDKGRRHQPRGTPARRVQVDGWHRHRLRRQAHAVQPDPEGADRDRRVGRDAPRQPPRNPLERPPRRRVPRPDRQHHRPRKGRQLHRPPPDRSLTMSVRILPAEFVFPGHPDKLSDAIADALVAEAIRREPRALVGVEVAVHRAHVIVTGRVACRDAGAIDVEAIVRDTYRSAGYGNGWHPAPEDIHVDNHLCLGPLEEGEADFRALSDDQAICIGYANDLPQTNHLPVEHWLARKLAGRLHRLATEHPGLALGPDGKVIVFLGDDGSAWSVEAFSCSLQQREAADDVALHRAVRLAVEEELARLAQALPGLSARMPDRLTVNGAGAFEVGGPEGDNGLSGKKLVVDAYGPRVQVGGGAWSGKDFFKADRAGALHARRLAKLAIRLGLAREATVTLGWHPGEPSARVLRISTDRGDLENAAALADMVDLSLVRSGERFSRTHDLVEISRWGHFSDPSVPWEKTDLL